VTFFTLDVCCPGAMKSLSVKWVSSYFNMGIGSACF